MNDKKYDICIPVGSSTESWAASMAKLKIELEKLNYSVVFFSFSKRDSKYLESAGIKDFITLPEYLGKIDVNWCIKWLSSFGVYNIRFLYRTEHLLYGNREEYCQNAIVRNIHALQSLADGKKARYYFTYVGDELYHNTFRLLCRMHQGKMIYFGFTNIQNRLYFTESDERYFEISKDGIPPPSQGQIAQLRNYIYEYTSKKTILWGDPSDVDIKIKMNLITKFIRSAIKTFQGEIIRPEHRVHRLIYSFAKRLYRRQRAYSFYEQNQHEMLNDKFYYFPLHFPLDSQLTMAGIPFFNQSAIVEIVSQYIPYPYQLVVKEHPHARGFSSISDIKIINKLSNVKLLDPSVNSHDIIPKAEAVVAINSSVGYEAILYRKPVITLGKSFYRGHGLTIDVNSLYELEKACIDASSFVISEEQVIQFLWRLTYYSYDVDTMKFLRSVPGEEHKVAIAIDSWIRSKQASYKQ